uniref:Protein CASP n=1 Tax=Rhizophora mucronata TaxID=61149 RepID=A0A2P2M2H1_RHIMU
MWEVQVVLGSKGLFPMAQMAQSRHTIETGEYQEMQPNSVEKCKSASIPAREIVLLKQTKPFS